MTNWITIATYNTPVEANMIKNLLESYQIPCFIKSENMGALYFNVIGGIEIQVPDFEVPRAINIVTNTGIA